MSSARMFPRSLVKLPISVLVKSKVIPANPVDDHQIDTSKPVIYALPFRSNVDLFTLRHQALALGLPDPLEPVTINGTKLGRFVYIGSRPPLFGDDLHIPSTSVSLFSQLLSLHADDPELDVQVLPVSVLWGRKPGKEENETPYLQAMNGVQKAKAMLFAGRDCLVRFSPAVSLRHMADVHGTDQSIALKLARVARIHFSRQKLAVSGPNLPDREQLFTRLLDSPALQKAIEEEANSQGVSTQKVRKEAHSILDEIAANFSYSLVRQGDRFLGWLWNKLYQGLNIHNAATVRKLAQDGHEIVYVPCHRSHMDYLLLSYVLYHEGMVPPHIAAGINLNFFPAGPLFRRGGAFFIRRSFKGNKLYSTIFREYLAELFAKGYAVEYFSEGGRSRTGRLLQAKTGMLAMTIQAMLRGLNRPVTLVPVYIGYEHVMEVSTYAKELRGKRKEKENAGQVLRILRKLRNFGQGYVNFGEPIPLNHYLNTHVPEWTRDINPLEAPRPEWMTPVVNQLATKMMTHINSAAAANALTLCATALLASRQRALARETLVAQIELYTSLLRNVPYSETSTVPAQSASELVEHAISLNKFVIERDSIGEIISLDRQQSILMTYYRNNIIHLFALPSLIAQLVVRHRSLSYSEAERAVRQLYPFLQKELFLHYREEELGDVIAAMVEELVRQGLIEQQGDQLSIRTSKTQALMLLAQTITETLQRYAIALNQLVFDPEVDKTELEQRCQQVAQRLGRLHGINAPEFFDPGVFASLFSALKQEHYLDSQDRCNLEQTQNLADMLSQLLTSEVSLTIQESLVNE